MEEPEAEDAEMPGASKAKDTKEAPKGKGSRSTQRAASKDVDYRERNDKVGKGKYVKVKEVCTATSTAASLCH